jgi:hypothetical protein
MMTPPPRTAAQGKCDREVAMAYSLEGDLLEVCTCNVLCPCWIGEDPDGEVCQSTLAYRFERGEIDGVDVSGVVAGGVVHIPGNVLDGNWQRRLYISATASDEQAQAVIDLMQGRKGGPLAELAKLIGKELEVRRAPIIFELDEGAGTFRIEGVLDAEMAPYKGPTGETTTLNESIFSTIPGSPAYVAKAKHFRMQEPELGIDLDLRGHNAIQGKFRFEHAEAAAA